MCTTYFKRFRMEIDLRAALPAAWLPRGFVWVPWDDALIERHAEVKFQCFRGEIDAAVFSSLGDRIGCHRLMREIRQKQGFLPEATWLVAGAEEGCCGTVQGVRDWHGGGSIQNLGILPAYRGRGLGSALLLKSLHGFRAAGLQRAILEVTASNDSAVRLYRQLGFRCRKTLYKAVEQVAAESPALVS